MASFFGLAFVIYGTRHNNALTGYEAVGCGLASFLPTVIVIGLLVVLRRRELHDEVVEAIRGRFRAGFWRSLWLVLCGFRVQDDVADQVVEDSEEIETWPLVNGEPNEGRSADDDDGFATAAPLLDDSWRRTRR